MQPIHYWELDKTKVATLIREQALKRWWVAESAGVHKTTLRRWLNGKIHRIQRSHLDSLAGVLAVPCEQIAVPQRA
jgi:hypothetical protein